MHSNASCNQRDGKGLQIFETTHYFVVHPCSSYLVNSMPHPSCRWIRPWMAPIPRPRKPKPSSVRRICSGAAVSSALSPVASTYYIYLDLPQKKNKTLKKQPYAGKYTDIHGIRMGLDAKRLGEKDKTWCGSCALPR